MSNIARLRRKWKVQYLDHLGDLLPNLKKPSQKLCYEVVWGMMNSGSVKLSEIARGLNEPIGLHHTLKRLSRMLCKHKLWTEIETMTLQSAMPQMTDETIIALDPGDLNRNGSRHSEECCRIRDGSTGDIVNGYALMSAVARDMVTGRTLPLLLRLSGSRNRTYGSENLEMLSVMSDVRQQLGDSHLWVIDRGGDRKVLWQHWLAHSYRVAVRVSRQRHWLWRGQRLSAQEIAKCVGVKHTGSLRRRGNKQVRFGITTVRLPDMPEHPLSMVIVRHGKKEPMVIVTTDTIRGKRQGLRVIHAYMDRWAVEEGYRFSKQGFDLEGVMARKIHTLKNLVAMAMLAWSFLAAKENDSSKLQLAGKPDKPKKKKIFPFYAMVKGWQALFCNASAAIYNCLRKRQPPTLPPVAEQLSLPGIPIRQWAM